MPGVFGAREGANELKVYDVAGNVTTVTFMLDVTGPTVGIDASGSQQVGNGRYQVIALTLADANRVDRYVLNGVATDVADAASVSVTGITRIGGRPTPGAVKGRNTLTVHDVAGNVTTFTFWLN